RQAYVLVVPVAPVTAIAAAGTEERKQVAHEIVVEVVDVAAVEGVLRRNVVIDSGGDFVRNIASRADRSRQVVYQGVVGGHRHEVEELQGEGIVESFHIGRVGEYARSRAADV